MWNVRLKEIELSQVTEKHDSPMKCKEPWFPSSWSCPHTTLPLQDWEHILHHESSGTCQGSCCLLNGVPMLFGFLSNSPRCLFFMSKRFFFSRYAGDLEKAGTQLCCHLPASDVGSRSVSHLPSSFFLPGTELWPSGEVCSTRVVSY